MKFIRKLPLSQWIAESFIMLLALVALRKDNAYEFYVILRWMACPLFVWIAWKAFSMKGNMPLTVCAALIALLFNPLIRIHLERERWEVLNIAMIAVALWSLVQSLIKPNRTS
jgi:hypothetical protein